MAKKRLSKSIRKYIRREKSRIRREILDPKKQEEKIQELLQKFHPGKKELSSLSQ